MDSKNKKLLRIGLDMRPLETGYKAHLGRGTGRYTSELARGLNSLVSTDYASEMAIIPVGTKELQASSWERKFINALPVGKRTVESQFLFAKRIGAVDLDLMHFLSHGDAPAYPRTPQVVTVLDLIPLRFPELYRAKKSNARFRFARFLEYEAIKRARGVFAISQATKRDLIDLLGVSDEKIIVTPLAVSDHFVPRFWGLKFEELAARKKLGLSLEAPLIVYVGGIDPRKNVRFLVRAFAELLKNWDKHSASSPCRGMPEPQLVLAGNYENDDQFSLLKEEIKWNGVDGRTDRRTVLLGYVPEDALLSLYHLASVVAFPSLYEGFGLPVLEAMACGTPVIAGNNSSIPEVAGDAAILLEDNNLGAWVSAMKEVLTSEELRLSMSEASIQQARRFSWDDTARQTLSGYFRFLERAFPQSKTEKEYALQLGLSPEKLSKDTEKTSDSHAANF